MCHAYMSVTAAGMGIRGYWSMRYRLELDSTRRTRTRMPEAETKSMRGASPIAWLGQYHMHCFSSFTNRTPSQPVSPSIHPSI